MGLRLGCGECRKTQGWVSCCPFDAPSVTPFDTCCSSQFATEFGETPLQWWQCAASRRCSVPCTLRGDTAQLQGHTVQCQGGSRSPCCGRKARASHRWKLKGMYTVFIHKRLPRWTWLYCWQCGGSSRLSLPTAGCCPLCGPHSGAGLVPQLSQLTAWQLGVQGAASPVPRGWSASWAARTRHPCWEDGSLWIWGMGAWHCHFRLPRNLPGLPIRVPAHSSWAGWASPALRWSHRALLREEVSVKWHCARGKVSVLRSRWEKLINFTVAGDGSRNKIKVLWSCRIEAGWWGRDSAVCRNSHWKRLSFAF